MELLIFKFSLERMPILYLVSPEMCYTKTSQDKLYFCHKSNSI